MKFPVVRFAGLALLACLVSACGRTTTAAAPPNVAVTMVQPRQQRFARSIAAFGSVIGNPRHARHLSLAHGGEVVAIMVSNGQSVAAGQTLMKIATAPAARQTFIQARNALALAQDQLTRNRKLAARHLATQAQVSAARKSVGDAKAALQAQRQLGGGQAVDRVTAPVAGVVTGIKVTRGQRVPANAVLATFTPAHGLVARLGVQPDQAAHIAPGMPVTLQTVYGPSGNVHGKVGMVGHAVDPATHLVPVQVALSADGASHLVAGSALSARIDTARFKAWAVPRQALQSDAHGDHVFQVEHGKAHRVGVKVVSSGGSPVGVTGSLDPHAPVITLGSYEVSDGQAVHAGHAGTSRERGTPVQ